MATGRLISYAGYPYALSSLFPDNGLASLASALRSAGHDCRVLDYNTAETMARLVDRQTHEELTELLPRLASPDDDVYRRLRAISARAVVSGRAACDDVASAVVRDCLAHRVDFVGFKLWSGDGFEASVRIAERLRAALPRIKLFAGGPAVHYSGREVAKEASVFDAIIDGDGEEAILSLARYAEGSGSLSQTPNLIWPGDEPAALVGTDLGTAPLPVYDRDAYPSVADGAKLRLFCLDESRGCPMRCGFCINRSIQGSRWRTRTLDSLLQHIGYLRDTLGSRAFRLAGTYSPPKTVQALCEGIISRKLDVEFGLFLHARKATEESLRLLREAGCYGVFIGAESGSDRILHDAMHKQLHVADLRHTIELTLQAGLFVAASFIFPAPFEDAESESATRQLICDLFTGREDASVLLSFPGLIPRTEWWGRRDHYGFSLEVDEDTYRRLLLRYKIPRILPPSHWEPLPYRLGGQNQPSMARVTSALQAWLEARGIVMNLTDHDAQVGSALGQSPAAFAHRLRRILFTGDASALQEIVDRSNEAFGP